MLQHIFKALLFSVLALLAPSASAAAHDKPSNLDANLLFTPPPTPTNLVITGVTGTSISLQWLAPGAPFYRIRAIDVTGSQALPLIHGTGNQADVLGLIPGHLYHFYVSVAYAADEPFSDPAFTKGTTGYIIVDKIIGLQNACKPSQSYQGQSHNLCVKKSTSSDPEQYDNGSVGRILFGDAELRFAVVYTIGFASAPELHIGKLYDQNNQFLFQQSNNGQAACFYKSPTGTLIPMFKAVSVGFFEVNEATITLNFSPGFWSGGGSYSFCTQCRFKPDSKSDSRNTPQNDTPAQPDHVAEPFVSVSPNPFTESTSIRYSLEVPSLVSIQLYDAIGHLVQTVQPSTLIEAGEYTAALNGSGLSSGTYFLMVQKGAHRQIVALVKQQ